MLRDDVLPATNWTCATLAAEVGVTPHEFSRVLAGNAPVTPEIAEKLGALFGNGPNLWLNMQAARDAWFAEKEKKT
jgi:addiction module HigA family antidote